MSDIYSDLKLPNSKQIQELKQQQQLQQQQQQQQSQQHHIVGNKIEQKQNIDAVDESQLISTLEKENIQLKEELTKKDAKIHSLLKNSATLLKNISTLYKTARKEMESRDITIATLQLEASKRNIQMLTSNPQSRGTVSSNNSGNNDSGSSNNSNNSNKMNNNNHNRNMSQYPQHNKNYEKNYEKSSGSHHDQNTYNKRTRYD